MAEEQFKATTALFGEDAVERLKKRHDALKTRRTIKQPFQKDGAQRTNRFGCRENQGYTQQSWFKPWTARKQSSAKQSSQGRLVRSPPVKMLRTSSAPPSEVVGNIRNLCMAPSWLEGTVRPHTFQSPSSVAFLLISLPSPVFAGRFQFFIKNWRELAPSRGTK